MAVDWNERWRVRPEDERIYRAIKTGDWRTALMELFKEVREVRICKHENMTDCEPCPQCDAELDALMSGGIWKTIRKERRRFCAPPTGG